MRFMIYGLMSGKRCRGEGRSGTDIVGPLSRDLIGAGWVDGVVDGSAGDLAADVAVDGGEAGRLALGFAGAAGVDDCWGGEVSLREM